MSRATVERLYAAFAQLDAETMAACYAPDASSTTKPSRCAAARRSAACGPCSAMAVKAKGRDVWKIETRDITERTGALGGHLPILGHRAFGAQHHRCRVRVRQRRPDHAPPRPLRFLALGTPGLGAPGLLLGWSPFCAPRCARRRPRTWTVSSQRARPPDRAGAPRPQRRRTARAVRGARGLAGRGAARVAGAQSSVASRTIAATWALDADAALQAARDSEARWQRGQARALDGVTGDGQGKHRHARHARSAGHRATVLTPAAADAPPARAWRGRCGDRVQDHDAPTYGMLSSGPVEFPQAVAQPLGPSKNPGGSQRRAAAACAAGYGPLHLGTDIGGSIRCRRLVGVFGLKPSGAASDPSAVHRPRGRPPHTQRAGCRHGDGCVSLPDARDTTSLPYQDIAWTSSIAAVAAWRGAVARRRLGAGHPIPRFSPRSMRRHAFEGAGAIVEPLAPLHHPRDGRRHGCLLAHARLARDFDPAGQRQARVLPYHPQLGRGWRRAQGAQVFRGYSQMAHCAMPPLRLPSASISCSAGQPGSCPYPAEFASPLKRPGASVRAHRLSRCPST